MRRILLFDREFWRFYGRLARRTPWLLWDASKVWVTFTGIASLYLGFNQQLARLGLSVFGSICPVWALLPVGLLFVYGMIRANYEAFRQIEADNKALAGRIETEERRAILNDLLGNAHEAGERIYDLGGDIDFLGWANYTYDLIMAAYGKSQAQIFLSSRDIGPSPPQNPRDRYGYINERLVGNPLRRLEALMNRTDLSILPDFDYQAFTRQAEQFSAEQINSTVALAQSKAETARLEAVQAERVKADRDREQFVSELWKLITEGDSLASHDYSTQPEVEDWEERAAKLIEMALGTNKRRNFQLKVPDLSEPYRSANPEATEQQIRAMDLLDRLRSLTMEVNRVVPPPLNLFPEFNIEDYQRWLKGL